jgi:hypothetical protein
MTTTTGTQVDQRKNPGDGKLAPVKHIVRIVVVRPAGDAPAALQVAGPGHSHELTDRALKAAEAALKAMNAPPSSSGTSGPANALSTVGQPQKTMFDVLKPTDIVVIGREPASLRTVDNSGTATRRLFAHDDGHRDTVLKVWTESDTVEYQCDVPFAIQEVAKSGQNRITAAPDNPFERGRGSTPYPAVRENNVHTWTSDTVPATANDQQYKMTFLIDGQEVDPDIVCGDPPPN